MQILPNDIPHYVYSEQQHKKQKSRTQHNTLREKNINTNL